MRVQVLGLLRFSYPSVFNKRGADDMSAYRATLYDPARLRRRMIWLRHLVLPSLARQQDQDFEVLLMVGDQLPEPFRTELLDLVAGVPQIRPMWTPEGQRHRLAVKHLVESQSDRGADLVAEVVMDDDDAIGPEVVDGIRAQARVMAPMLEAHPWATLDYVSGLGLEISSAHIAAAPIQARLWGIALATYRRPSTATMIVRKLHLDYWKYMPVLSDQTPHMWLRGVHEDNASTLLGRWQKHGTGEALDAPERVLWDRFGVDLAAIQAELRRVETG